MSIRLEKCVRQSFYKCTDEEIREFGNKHKGIPIFYGYNTYSADIPHIMKLRNAIKNDYPNIEDKDIEVWKIRESESRRHAHFTTLTFRIPAEEFIRLRNAKEIYCL